MPKLMNTSAQPSPGTAVRRACWAEVHRLMQRMQAWQTHRQASRALHALSDTNLKDIGLHRSEVDSRLIDMEPRRRKLRASA